MAQGGFCFIKIISHKSQHVNPINIHKFNFFERLLRMGTGLSIKIDYGGEKTGEMPQKRCFTGNARCGTIGA